MTASNNSQWAQDNEIHSISSTFNGTHSLHASHRLDRSLAASNAQKKQPRTRTNVGNICRNTAVRRLGCFNHTLPEEQCDSAITRLMRCKLHCHPGCTMSCDSGDKDAPDCSTAGSIAFHNTPPPYARHRSSWGQPTACHNCYMPVSPLYSTASADDRDHCSQPACTIEPAPNRQWPAGLPLL